MLFRSNRQIYMCIYIYISVCVCVCLACLHCMGMCFRSSHHQHASKSQQSSIITNLLYIIMLTRKDRIITLSYIDLKFFTFNLYFQKRES